MNKIIVDLGFIEIRWYSVIMLIAILVSASLILKEAKKKRFYRRFYKQFILLHNYICNTRGKTILCII